ncbi:hemin receptor [Brucella intermedia]|uniref:hemin receptor n=1 Tax=Brucella intermedia TaxID=94625 RepID=UPI0023623CBE|nr:hemin receptor [Brucella intermedia]
MIGPHDGKELALLLSGEKGVARFSVTENLSPEDVGDAEFEPHVRAGKIKKHIVHSKSGPPIETRYYYLAHEEWRLKLDLLISELMHTPAMKEFTSEDLYRLDGWLLGYDAEDVEDFIAQWKERRNKHISESDP